MGPQNPHECDDLSEAAKPLLPIVKAARRYHRHEVLGLEHVPATGRALVIVNHSLATYDIILLIGAIYEHSGRVARPLIDRLFFKVPGIGDLVQALGARQGSQENAEALLESDHIITVAPGGMREALRPTSDRYQICWEKRTGFVKLAMRTKTPIILAACPKADDLFDVYPSHLTKWFYQAFRVPVFFARGVGPTLLPRPVKLVHHLSPALPPPEWSDDPAECDARVASFHAMLVERMHQMMTAAS